MSKYEIKKPNRQYNDWDAIEGQIERLDKKIDEAVLGEQSFSNIQGDPYDNTALSEALNEKADVGDSYTKAEDDALLNLKADKSDTYTKTEVDTLLDDKADVGDSYTKAEDDALLDNKVDKETGKELMPSTLPDRVTQNETDIQDLKDDKQDKMQFEVMPDAEEYLGKIVQYVGPTDLQYTNGIFYQADYDSALLEYKWIPKSSGGGSGEYIAGQGIEITDNIIKCTIISDTITSTTTTWSSQKLRQEFENLAGATRVIVAATRPQVGELNTIYYIGTEAPYEIWLYTSANTWVYLGETGINLEDYYKKSEVDNLINDVKPVAGGDATTIGIIPNHGGRTVSVNVDDSTIKINGTTNKLYAPLKTINSEALSGSGNIVLPTMHDLYYQPGDEWVLNVEMAQGYVAFTSTGYQGTIHTLKNLRDISQVQIINATWTIRNNNGYLYYRPTPGSATGQTNTYNMLVYSNGVAQMTGITGYFSVQGENTLYFRFDTDVAGRMVDRVSLDPQTTNTPLFYVWNNIKLKFL